MPLCSTRDAATSSWVDSGFEAQSATSAPPAASVSIRFAVSVVTCRQAATRTPCNGFSLSKRSLIWAITGISPAAQSILPRPDSESPLSLMSCPIGSSPSEGVGELGHHEADRLRGRLRREQHLLVGDGTARGVRDEA